MLEAGDRLREGRLPRLTFRPDRGCRCSDLLGSGVGGFEAGDLLRDRLILFFSGVAAFGFNSSELKSGNGWLLSRDFKMDLV